MGFSVGIDFGTTNTAAAIAIDSGAIRLVPLESDYTTIPTAIYFSDDGQNISFGRAANLHYENDEPVGRLMRSIKRILGGPLMNGAGTQIAGRFISFDIIIARFLQQIKNKIDMAAGENVQNVIMGRPVCFRENDAEGDIRAENELRRIAESIGFKNIEFQFEPIAAAFAHEQKLLGEKLALVLDIGGGTSDFTVIRLSPARANNPNRASDILSNVGLRIGGNDFDKNLSLGSFMPEFGMGSELSGVGNKILPMPNGIYFDLSTWSSVNDAYTMKSLNAIRDWQYKSRDPIKLSRLRTLCENNLGHKNLEYVENAKIKLSSETNAEIILDFIADSPIIKTRRELFQEFIADDISKIQSSALSCVAHAGVKNWDIDLIILTGGSTEIPIISDIMKSLFPHAQLSMDDKLSSVAMGLGITSARRF